MKQKMIQHPAPPRTAALTRLLTVALIALTTLAACHNELDEPANATPDDAPRTVTLTAAMPARNADGAQTRVAYDDTNLKLTWEVGDKLIVYATPANSGDPLGAPLGTLDIDPASFGSGDTNAQFTGTVPPSATGLYSLRYAPASAAADTPAQVQKANNNRLHLTPLLALSADGIASLDGIVTLKLDAAILKLHIALTAEQVAALGTPKSLKWNSQTSTGARTMTLGLDGVTPDDTDRNSITAYIAFRPDEMKLAPGGTFSVILAGSGSTQYIATATADATTGKVYEPGKQYTVKIGDNADELPLTAQAAVVDGTQPFDPSIFNGNTTWVIGGGGTPETNTAVKTNVKNALLGLSAGSINLTLTEVTELPELTFKGRPALASINLPKATTIGNAAFQSCSVLTTANLPLAATFGDNVFYNCTGLTTLSLPAATKLGFQMFNNCTALTHLELTAASTIMISNNTSAFENFVPAACDLVLNPNKQPGSSGSPLVDADGKTWGGVTWKSITYATSAAPAARRSQRTVTSPPPSAVGANAPLQTLRHAPSAPM